MARLHLFVGLAFAAVFLLTGLYMRATFPTAWQGDAGVRMMYRAAHVYILLGALLNLLASANAGSDGVTRPRLRAAGSVLLLLTPAIFTLSFFFEPAPDRFQRSIALAGLIVAAAGAALYTITAPRRAGPGAGGGPDPGSPAGPSPR